MPALLSLIFAGFRFAVVWLAKQIPALILWIGANRIAARAVVVGVGLSVIGVVSAKVLSACSDIVSRCVTLMNVSPEVSFLAIANTIIPLTEIFSQMMLLISVRIGLIVFNVSIYFIRASYNAIIQSRSEAGFKAVAPKP